MAITHSAAVRGAFAQAVLTAVDAGDGYGKIVLMESDDTVVCEITLAKPSFTRSGAVLTLAGTPLNNAADEDGTIAKFSVVDSDDNIIYEGTAGTTASDLIVDNTSVNEGQNVRVTAGQYTASA
jgi:hypothetical protein